MPYISSTNIILKKIYKMKDFNELKVISSLKKFMSVNNSLRLEFFLKRTTVI